MAISLVPMSGSVWTQVCARSPLMQLGSWVGKIRLDRFEEKLSLINARKAQLEDHWCHPGDVEIETLVGKALGREYNLANLLKRPNVSVENLIEKAGYVWPDEEVNEQIEIDLKYEGYISRQQEEIDRLKSEEGMVIPAVLDYGVIIGLSNEVRQKLTYRFRLYIYQFLAHFI